MHTVCVVIYLVPYYFDEIEHRILSEVNIALVVGYCIVGLGLLHRWHVSKEGRGKRGMTFPIGAVKLRIAMMIASYKR